MNTEIINYLNEFINNNINKNEDLILLQTKLKNYNEDIIKQLLKDNSKLYNIVKELYSNNAKDIQEKGTSYVSNNAFLVTLLDIYIDMENIDVYDITNNLKYSSSLNIYLSELKKYKVLSKEEELELFIKYKEQNDLKARKSLIEHNLRLVVFVAKKYINEKMEINDIIEEGNIGLMIALERFNYKRGYKFSTYAVYWINQNILRTLRKSNDYKISRALDIEVRHYNKLKRELEMQYQRPFDYQELSVLLNINIEKVMKYEDINSISKISLNTQLDGNKKERIDFIVDQTKNIEDDFLRKNMIEKLNRALNSGIITEKEKEIILRKYGFYNREYTYEEIGELVGISKQAAQQQERRTIRKLKESKEFRNFKSVKDE